MTNNKADPPKQYGSAKSRQPTDMRDNSLIHLPSPVIERLVFNLIRYTFEHYFSYCCPRSRLQMWMELKSVERRELIVMKYQQIK